MRNIHHEFDGRIIVTDGERRLEIPADTKDRDVQIKSFFKAGEPGMMTRIAGIFRQKTKE